ncbi:MAG: hypothetical protein GX567_18970 [Clostridia bacterium]|nr:hypothetical protein [Clostridia bacterium]
MTEQTDSRQKMTEFSGINELYSVYRKSAIIKMTGVLTVAIGLLLWYGLARLFELGIIGNQISPKARTMLPFALLFLLMLLAAVALSWAEWMKMKRERSMCQTGECASVEDQQVRINLWEARRQRFKMGCTLTILGILAGMLGFVILAGYSGSTKKMILAGTCWLIVACGASIGYFTYEWSMFDSLHQLVSLVEMITTERKQKYVMKQLEIILIFVTAAIFLYWGGRYLRWDICWIVFPIGLAIYGMISTITYGIKR